MAFCVFAWAQTPESRPDAEQPSPTAETSPDTADAPSGARITERGWFAPSQAAPKPPLPDTVTKAFVIPIREPISTKTFAALRRKALRCRAQGAELIILDMDTWGGEVISALDMTRLLKKDLGDIYVVCFVHTRAISAGSMIALACDEIIMANVGKLGDCAPILMQGTLEGVEREKIESPLRVEFEESAERNGYPVALAMSMVSYDLEVWLVRNVRTGELRYVLASDFRHRINNPDDAPRAPARDKEDADAATNDVGKQWEFLDVEVARGKLLTMTPRRAKEYGFASELVSVPPDDPYAPLRERYNISSPPTVLEDSWSENLVDFLIRPEITGLLVMLMLLFGYVEMHTPGFGVFGGIAIACLLALIGSRYISGLAQWWEIAAFGLGVVLIILELLVIPGFGVAGISGLLLCVAAILSWAIPNAPDRIPWPETTLDWTILTNVAIWLCLGFLGFGVLAGLLSRWLPSFSLFHRAGLVLDDVEPFQEAPQSNLSLMKNIQTGDEGVVSTVLHPVGKVRFGEDFLDAASSGGIIEPGRRVRVLRRDGNRLLVEEIR